MTGRLVAAVVVLSGLIAAPAVAAEPDYTPDPASLARHQVPRWFEDAKLGFFIHWGPYSVPAYAPPSDGIGYAEWYWSELNRPGSPTQQHQRDVYGEEFPYDRFIEQWKAERFDPDAWLRLFEQGGAKYFVQVTKHHDGVALFDTATTGRDTVELGPHRDFVRELFDAAERGDYGLKRGLYYSLPEWFHPLDTTFAQGPPRNPFTGEPVPYTGYTPISSYVDEHQYPQMLELIDHYDPDILWCDIGGANRSNEVMAHFFNQAKNRPDPKEVTVDNRCGNGIYDFTTPEYSVEPDINPAKWEATRGLGRSFGYNAEEGPDDYLSANELIDSFVDIVSKNGNLLLNLGPKADGTIPEIQAERVRALGEWLDVNGEAIYGSRYWRQAEDDDTNVPVRYTVNGESLYATALEWPGRELRLGADIAVERSTRITLLGAGSKPLRWRQEDGALVVSMPAEGETATTARHAYAFEIRTPGRSFATSVRMDPARAETTASSPVEVEVELGNWDRAPLADVDMSLTLPEGWTAGPLTPTHVARLPRGETATSRWRVSAPATARWMTPYDIGAQATHRRGGTVEQITGHPSRITVLPEPGSVAAPFKTLDTTPEGAQYAQSGDQFAIWAGGRDWSGGFDEKAVIYRDAVLPESGSVTTSVLGHSGGGPAGKAGLVVANDLADTAAGGYVMLTMSRDYGIELIWDSDGDGRLDGWKGGCCSYRPVWLRLVRSGTTYTGLQSRDGRSWEQVGEVTVPSAAGTQDAGMAVSAVNLFYPGEIGRGVFDTFAVTTGGQ